MNTETGRQKAATLDRLGLSDVAQALKQMNRIACWTNERHDWKKNAGN